MTHLLMLLLAVGQPHNTWVSDDSICYMAQVNGPDTTRIVAITNVLLFEYEAECYADSTNTRCHVGGPGKYGNTCWGWGDGCAEPRHYKMIWTHRTPTFPDFLKWLRRKVKP